MSYWQRRIEAITFEPAVPIVCSRMHRVFWVPRRYRALVAAAFDGRAFTVRGIAARTGYSVKGAWSALRALEQMGIGVVSTTRGWMGRTRFRVSSDARVGTNVSTTVRTNVEKREPTLLGSYLSSSMSVSVVETLPQMAYR